MNWQQSGILLCGLMIGSWGLVWFLDWWFHRKKPNVRHNLPPPADACRRSVYDSWS
jgi:hypothetical protein